jgi:ferredoxin-NADP reductase
MRAQPGRLDKDHLASLGLPGDAVACICGPDAFMTAISDALAGLGIAPAHIDTGLSGALGRVPVAGAADKTYRR